jgi:predicted lipid-binding transport protein (Tim44 family)
MKKLLSALIALTIVMSSIGSVILNDHSTTVEAKGYKSGKKNFNPSQNNFTKPKVDKKQEENNSFNKSSKTTSTKGGFFSGGLMRGLFVGGIAGLLFGSLFANMGILGSVLGFLINMLAIIFIVSMIRKIFSLLKTNREKEKANPWQN